MSNKIPGGQNNPLNYYSSWAQAFSKLKDAFDLSKVNKKGKAGFIDYEDWYNIVTELNNIAALGEPIEIAGKKLDGSLLAASELIQEGANALTTVDTGEIKVNLGAIGTGIASAGEFMNEGVTKGIQAMAESQVNMLDGLIQLLETIVAMQKLGDIDIDGNGIDLSEIFQLLMMLLMAFIICPLIPLKISIKCFQFCIVIIIQFAKQDAMQKNLSKKNILGIKEQIIYQKFTTNNFYARRCFYEADCCFCFRSSIQ